MGKKKFRKYSSIYKNPLNEAYINYQVNTDNYELHNVKKLFKYIHYFHNHFIEEWIKKQNNCPLCFNEWIQMKFLD